MTNTIENLVLKTPVNARLGCICPNGGRPINGQIFVNPSCRVHYAEQHILFPTIEEISKEEINSWHKKKKRVSYPKLMVARHGTKKQSN
jgi:hypothetical protein